MEGWHTSIKEELNGVDHVIRNALSPANPELAKMCSHIVNSVGKRIRPAICILSHKACGGISDKLLDVAAAFEIIHSATLIHDDINDNSEMRRGAKTLHRQYTVSKAIILGDLLFAIGFRLVSSCTKGVIDTITEASEAMADAEFIQKDNEHIPKVTEASYMKIIHGKTAMPILASAKIGTFLADADEKLADALSGYADNIGMAFQIIDDLLDITGNHKTTGKVIGADIMEGKPTLPIIYAMRDPVHGKKIKELFSKKDILETEVSEALELIKQTDALEKCRAKAEEFVSLALDAISPIPGSVYKDSLILLSDYILNRDR